MGITRRAIIVGIAAAGLCCAGPAPRRDPQAPPLPTDLLAGLPFQVRSPRPPDWRQLAKPVPSLDRARRWGPLRDLRHADLSRADLKGRSRELLDAFFDSRTLWPGDLPPGFDPAGILEANRDPGLGLRALHERGITGTGVAAAIIDTPLLLDHEEYADRLVFYDEINAWGEANFHGTLVASILAGRTCGVAPGATVFYLGCHNYRVHKERMVPDVRAYAAALEEILELNRRLPSERRIRVVSISAGWGPAVPGFRTMNRTVRRATAAGIFVVSANMFGAPGGGFWFWGLDRPATDDPNDPAVYRALPWRDWIGEVAVEESFPALYKRRLGRSRPPEFLLVPEGPKTVAHPHGRAEYGFYRRGGWSSVCPYIAGLYALACQVKPEITPGEFWRASLATGKWSPAPKDAESFSGRIVDPVRLVESLKRP